MKHKNAEYIIAFANGEKVEGKLLGGGWTPIYYLENFDYTGEWEFRIAPKIMRIGSRDAPVPETIYRNGYFVIDNGMPDLYFKNVEDRAKFWDALVAAVEEAS